jgi:hypothetical protein
MNNPNRRPDEDDLNDRPEDDQDALEQREEEDAEHGRQPGDEREMLLGDEGASEGGEEEIRLPSNPIKVFVIGLALAAALAAGGYLIYTQVIAPSAGPGTATQPATQPAGLVPIGPQFTDVTQEARLMVMTQMGDSATRKAYISESKGGGIAFLDYDNDGWLDAYILNAGPLTRAAGERPAADFLMHNRGDGTFENVSATAGIPGPGYSIGVCCGDYDNDGFIDVFVTGIGGNALYRNRGDGTFEDVTEKAGVKGPGAYSVGATFVDYDGDGRLDLFVANYVALDRTQVLPLSGRWKSGPVFFGPRGLKGTPCILYRQNADGTFTDVSEEAGITRTKDADGKAAPLLPRALGVVAADLDDDGRPDLLVACDREPRLYFHNRGDGTFEEIGLVSGLAYAEGGAAHASQGIDVGDLDNDQRLDVVVGTMSGQPASVYLNYGRNCWTDSDALTGLGGFTMPLCTFGVAVVDYNLDGRPDVITANGHLYPDAEQFDASTRYALPMLIGLNEGRARFRPLIGEAGAGVAVALASRGLAVGDYDNDGCPDLLVHNIDNMPTLLRNGGAAPNRGLVVRLEGTKSNRSAIGARVLVRSGAMKQVAVVKSGSGFASQSDLRQYLGLGTASQADEVSVRWPSGLVEQAVNVPAGSFVTAVEGKGVTWKPLEKAEGGAARPVRAASSPGQP